MAAIFALAIGYVFSQFYRSFLAVLTPQLSADLGATNADLSVASGVWFSGFALAQFAVGIWLDRYGPRRTAALFLAVAALGAFVFAAASAPWMLVVAMALLGVGCAAALMSSVFIFAHVYAPARMAVLTSWMVAFGSAGNVLGSSPLAAAAESFGWRPVMTGLGIATTLTAAAIAILVRNPPNPDRRASSGWSGYGELMRLRVLWPIIPLTAFAYASAGGIRALWVGPYIADVYGADMLTIGHVSFAMALSSVVGALLYGPLDVLFGTRKWVSVAGTVLLVLAIAWLALHIKPDLITATAILVAIGLAGSSYGLLMAHGRAFFPPHLVGRGVALMNFFCMAGVGFMQFSSGALVTFAWRPDDPGHAYAIMFAFYAVMVFIALCIYLASRDAAPGRSIAREISRPAE